MCPFVSMLSVVRAVDFLNRATCEYHVRRSFFIFRKDYTMKKITNKLLWIFAVGQFGWSLLSGIVSNWMVYYYTGSPDEKNPNTGIFASGITQNPILFRLTLFGLVLAVGRIFDAITDPLIAGWSDRSKYKGGRRIPFMRAIAIPFALTTVALFLGPQTSKTAFNDTMLFVLILCFYLFMTIFCTPAARALSRSSSSKPIIETSFRCACVSQNIIVIRYKVTIITIVSILTIERILV